MRHIWVNCEPDYGAISRCFGSKEVGPVAFAFEEPLMFRMPYSLAYGGRDLGALGYVHGPFLPEIEPEASPEAGEARPCSRPRPGSGRGGNVRRLPPRQPGSGAQPAHVRHGSAPDARGSPLCPFRLAAAPPGSPKEQTVQALPSGNPVHARRRPTHGHRRTGRTGL